jgi:hydrogenase maturation protease
MKTMHDSSSPNGILIAGLGSHHGADAIGWLVVRTLKRLIPALSIVEAASPAEILDFAVEMSWLVICDGCQGAGPPGSIHRWRWPHTELRLLQSSGTHDLSLHDVLRLGETLATVPGVIDLWGVEVPCDSLSSDLQWLDQVASNAAAQIYAELTHA